MTTTMTTTLRGRRPLTCASTVAAAAVLLALSVAAGPAHAQPYPPPADLEPYTHPQRLVEVAPGRRLNLYCTGYGSPTVVLDAGFGNSAWTWGFVQPAVAGLTRVCSYDRAGEGWSDPGPLPRTSSAVVADLQVLLSAGGEPPPYVLVGHSWGGMNVTLYAYPHPEDLVGLVEVDPAVAGQFGRYAEIDPSSVKANYNQVKHLLYCADLARAGALADPAQQKQTACMLSDDPDAPAFQAASEYLASRASLWDTLASEEENLSITQPGGLSTDEQELEAARSGLGQRPLGALPLVVLQAAEGVPPQILAIRTELLSGIAAQSTRGVRVVVPNSGHDIQLEQPQAVIDAIARVVCAARAGTASSCP